MDSTRRPKGTCLGFEGIFKKWKLCGREKEIAIKTKTKWLFVKMAIEGKRNLRKRPLKKMRVNGIIKKHLPGKCLACACHDVKGYPREKLSAFCRLRHHHL